MNKFNTYDELVAERKRLQGLLSHQKTFIRSEIMEVRDKFAPISRVLSFFSRMGQPAETTAGKILKIGSNVGIDFLVGRKLKKAGWLARMVLPLVMKFTANRSIDAINQKHSLQRDGNGAR